VAATTTTTLASTTTTTAAPVCPAKKVLGQDSPKLEKLRAFRDGRLAASAVGRRLIAVYYSHAGSMDAALERSPVLRAAARSFFEAAAWLSD
jgi:hypothetical protein